MSTNSRTATNVFAGKQPAEVRSLAGLPILCIDNEPQVLDGMEVLGNVDYANERESYLGTSSGGTSHSGNTQKLIDDEVKKIVDEGYARAKQILTEKNDDLHRLAQGLLEYETLTGDQIRKVIAGEPLGGPDDAANSDGGGSSGVVAIPKTRARKPKASEQPEPSA